VGGKSETAKRAESKMVDDEMRIQQNPFKVAHA
jgi:hypothetical protein